MNLKQVLTCAALICATYPVACVPQPKPPTPDAGTGGAGPVVATGGASGLTKEQQACAKLNKLGCPEGFDVVKCSSDMTLRCANPKVTCATDCLISATSKTQVSNSCHLACGSL